MTDFVNYDRLKALLQQNLARHPISERERQEQALSFAYGNLACSRNHKPSRKAFVALAQSHYGWTAEEAEAWASTKKWEVE